MGACCYSKLVSKKQLDFVKSTAEQYMKHSDKLYHTMEHIDDVVCFVRLILASIRKKRIYCRTWKYIRFENNLIMAAYMHDLGHPMDESRVILEQLVHRKSVDFCDMENMSDFTTEKLHAELFKAECSKIIRDDDMVYILELIEATTLKTYTTNHIDLGKTIIRCADLSNFTDVWGKHKRSTRRLCDEMRTHMCPQKQMVFIEMVVLPQFYLLHSLVKTPETKAWIKNICDNLSMWNYTMMNQSSTINICPDQSVHIGQVIYDYRNTI